MTVEAELESAARKKAAITLSIILAPCIRRSCRRPKFLLRKAALARRSSAASPLKETLLLSQFGPVQPPFVFRTNSDQIRPGRIAATHFLSPSWRFLPSTAPLPSERGECVPHVRESGGRDRHRRVRPGGQFVGRNSE